MSEHRYAGLSSGRRSDRSMVWAQIRILVYALGVDLHTDRSMI